MSLQMRQCLALLEDCIVNATDEQCGKLMEIKSILMNQCQDAILIQEYNRVLRIPAQEFYFAKVENSLLMISTATGQHFIASTLDAFIKLNPGIIKIKRGYATLPANIHNLYAHNSRWFASVKGDADDIPVSRNEIKAIREKLA